MMIVAACLTIREVSHVKKVSARLMQSREEDIIRESSSDIIQMCARTLLTNGVHV